MSLKQMLKKLLIFLFVLFSFGVLYFWKSRDFLLQLKYDISHKNKSVNTSAEIEKTLNSWERVSLSNMDTSFIQQTKQNVAPYKNMIGKAVYYKIPQKDIYKKLVGNFRVKDFLPKDFYYKQALYGRKTFIYALLEKKMLFQVLAFQNELEAQGFDKNAFVITNGYRHPAFNEEIKGAKQSKHILGQAVDITAKDVNRDGQINQEDKKIILAVAEKVVGNQGGVGLYPGTLSIHMDCRGYKARWDSF